VLIVAYIVTALAAYLLGSIPTGYLVAKTRGLDIRSVGSGNIGATNVFRVLGVPAGVFVLVADGLKGFAACTWLEDVVLRLCEQPLEGAEAFRVVAGVCAVLGHSFSCWLRFKGGKGIATSAGVYFALAPLSAGIALTTWAVVFALSRYVSLASIAAAVALPAAVWLTPNGLALRIVTTAVGLLAIYKHRANIQRLATGTEHRVSGKKTSPSTGTTS
jgi:glycerol-3-phosphate acyltransferase PlsY